MEHLPKCFANFWISFQEEACKYLPHLWKRTWNRRTCVPVLSVGTTPLVWMWFLVVHWFQYSSNLPTLALAETRGDSKGMSRKCQPSICSCGKYLLSYLERKQWIYSWRKTCQSIDFKVRHLCVYMMRMRAIFLLTRFVA